MRAESASRIGNAAKQLKDCKVEVRERYYARGRGDRTTAAIVGPFADCVRAIAAAAAEEAIRRPDEVDEFIEDLDVSLDSMGHDVVIY